MPRYFFDIRDGTGLYPDEEGLDLEDERAARIEAAHALAGIARDAAKEEGRANVSIEVRTEAGREFHAAYIFEEGTKS